LTIYIFNQDSLAVTLFKFQNRYAYAFVNTSAEAFPAEALTCRFKYDGAIFNTCAAAGAAVFDDSAGTFSDFDLEISGRTLHALKICVGDQFDI